MEAFRRFVILTHRYLGIPMSVLFMVWFVSGIVMIYAGGMPALAPDVRLARLEPLDFDRVSVSPDVAAAAAGHAGSVAAAKLQMALGRPVYRLRGAFGRTTTVFADTGEVFEGAGVEAARREVARYAGAEESAVRFAGSLSGVDQWTLTLSRDLPLYRFDVDDGAGTRVYVAERTGEVALVTDRLSRGLAWAGTIPHWFYFTPLRTNQPLWYWTVVWASVLGCVLAVLGLVLGVTQFRRSQPFRLSASVRYRGWMRWHYWTGIAFGLFALTWVFSGLMSMEPFEWTNATGLEIPRDVFQGGEIELDAYPALGEGRIRALLTDAGAKEVEYARIQGEPYFVVRYGTAPLGAERERLHEPYDLVRGGLREPGRLLVDARHGTIRKEPFSADSMLAILRDAVSAARVADWTLLEEYDAYYYSRSGQAPLPVLRVEFDDPMRTWYYIDPATSSLVTATHRLSRLERWLFNGLHSLDFGFWYYRRPLWDIGVILLSLGALATSVIGFCYAIKRLTRARRREPVPRVVSRQQG